MRTGRLVQATSVLLALAVFLPSFALAHCDTMDGPVVADAKVALDKRDPTPILKWVRKDKEPEIVAAFKKTLAVRAQGADARELADMYFFETLVRIHRAGEGAPYTGLKPSGTDPGPAVRAADDALAHGSADALVKAVTDHAAAGIRQRFARASEAKSHAQHNVAAGREFVEAYVEFTHYVERLHQDVVGTSAHAHASESANAPADHAHHQE